MTIDTLPIDTLRCNKAELIKNIADLVNDNINEVIAIIRAAKTPVEAIMGLIWE